MTIETELKAIAADVDILKSIDVVTWANANRESDLGNYFVWDNEKAGHEYRLYQARKVIRIYLEKYDDGEPEFVSLSIDRHEPGGGYRRVEDVIKVPSLMEVMLADALKELERVRLRYNKVEALSSVWKAIEERTDAIKNTGSEESHDYPTELHGKRGAHKGNGALRAKSHEPKAARGHGGSAKARHATTSREKEKRPERL